MTCQYVFPEKGSLRVFFFFLFLSTKSKIDAVTELMFERLAKVEEEDAKCSIIHYHEIVT